jgi:pimeloyl-ACP methyl ester carboxylesterase
MSEHVSDEPDVRVETHRPTSGDWRLDVSRYWKSDAVDPSRRPVVMVPGYAMNAYILGYHPTGRSMVGYLVDRGFEVWTANLRGQGASAQFRGDDEYGFRDIALSDLPAVCELILEETATDCDWMDVIGCSIGISYLYAYLAHHPETHGVESVVAIGGPLRWEDVHPAVRLVFASPTVAGALPSKGTRLMARLAISFVERLPPIASIYMNVHQIELDRAGDLVKTIDDPHPKLNREIARWIRHGDLVVGGVDVTRALAEIETRTLCVLANRDGIVPEASVLSIREVIGTDDVSLLRVGDDDNWFAHADLFISEHAEREVFEPLGDWLEGP